MGKLIGLLMLCLWTGSAGAAPVSADDIITVDGKDWLQPDLFLSVPWRDMLNVCPDTNCELGLLNGYDLSGWKWATRDVLNGLFNFYVGEETVYPHSVDGSEFPMLIDGWRTTNTINGTGYVQSLITGYTWDHSPTYDLAYAGYFSAFSFIDPADDWSSYAYFNTGDQAHLNGGGGWFYRTSEVPIPATLALFGLGLAGLGWSRRKKS